MNYDCEICNKKLSSQYSLARHMKEGSKCWCEKRIRDERIKYENQINKLKEKIKHKKHKEQTNKIKIKSKNKEIKSYKIQIELINKQKEKLMQQIIDIQKN